jgi:cyclic pyranopterin phosphate synthase
MADFTHLDGEGRIQMVDVTEKGASRRRAAACGKIAMKPETLAQILSGRTKKGNVLETARIAGIMAAKRTADLIPLCHPLSLTHVQVDFHPDKASSAIDIEASAQVLGSTGVEMEALTAVAVAALTIYDMCKAVDREMVLSDIQLVEKTGGKSGTFRR